MRAGNSILTVWPGRAGRRHYSVPRVGAIEPGSGAA
jgi:hypothetical protein